MMNLKFGILFLALLALSCSKPAEQTEAPDPNQIKMEIQDLEDRNSAWINSKNVDSIVQYYADDAISYDSNSKPLYGKDQIRKSLENIGKAFPKTAKIEYTVKEVFPFEDGNRVVEIGHYKVSDTKGKNYGSGNYFAILEKRDGKYVCIRDIQTPDSPY